MVMDSRSQCDLYQNQIAKMSQEMSVSKLDRDVYLSIQDLSNKKLSEDFFKFDEKRFDEKIQNFQIRLDNFRKQFE